MNCYEALLLLGVVLGQVSWSEQVVAPSVRFSDPIHNGISNDFIGRQRSTIPSILVSIPPKDPKDDIPGKPLDPSDFERGNSLQMANSPSPTAEDDPIMNAKLFEGDIEIPNTRVLNMLNDNLLKNGKTAGLQRNAIIEKSSLWQNALIPYSISRDFDENERAIISKGIDSFHQNTCIRFRSRNEEDDYIFITKGNGCSSAVGRVRGRQTLSLGRGCVYAGVVSHELMHAAGFWHEHSRPDRDSRVTVLKENILSGMEYNFEMLKWDFVQSVGAPYDTGSLMHYGENAFSKGRGKPTIIANRGEKIGQRSHLSEIDILKLNRLYDCDKTAPVVTVPKPKPITSEVCQDSNEHCNYWSTIGECENNAAWMESNCKKSCKTCNKQCKNDNSLCDTWKKDGHCTAYPQYMTAHCKMSCGTCDGGSGSTSGSTGCVDDNNFCPDWEKTGECFANPTYMLTNCRKSCKQC